MHYSTQIEPRSDGSWKATILEDDVPVGGGVFQSWDEAQDWCLDWLDSRQMDDMDDDANDPEPRMSP